MLKTVSKLFTLLPCFRQKNDLSATAPVPKLVTGAFGGFAGFCSVMGNTPLDVVKTRMQGLEAKQYKNVFHCAYKIMTLEGPRA